MIITTLAAKLYEGEDDILSALMNIITKISYHAALVDNRYAELHESIAQRELIRRKSDGTWEIQNPVNPAENFAERWHDDGNIRAKAFFAWVACVRQDMEEALRTASFNDLKELLSDRFGERAFNNAWSSYESSVQDHSLGLTVGAPRMLTRFKVQHRQPPFWLLRLDYPVSLSARIKTNGNWKSFESDCQPLPKYCDLLFSAQTNVPKPFNVYWQVVNTGREAEEAKQLRGQIFSSKIAGAGGLTQNEATLYTGVHWIECFIVKNGICVARSGEFVVNII